MSGKRRTEGRDSLPAKRARFDGHHATMLAPEESLDPLEQDIGLGHARKKDVKLDGYASDSSEEGHGVARPVTLESEAGPVDEEDDMFGEAPSKAAAPHVRDADKKKKQRESFLELNDIEGQDFKTSTEYMDIVDEDASDAEDDESVDEEVGALGRKMNAPKLDGFNMRAEMEDGKFDADGNYIRTAKDQKDNQDDWLKDVSRRDIHAAKVAVERRAMEDARREADEDRTSVSDLLAELVSYLDRGETLLEALSRRGSSGAAKRRGKKGKTAVNGTVKEVERMTELANRLMAKSPIDVYDTPREGLCREYRKETGTDLPFSGQDNIMEDQSLIMWEFIWPGAEDSVNGPYDTETMKSWLRDGLLQSDSSTAKVRRIGEIVFVDVTSQLFTET